MQSYFSGGSVDCVLIAHEVVESNPVRSVLRIKGEFLSLGAVWEAMVCGFGCCSVCVVAG